MDQDHRIAGARLKIIGLYAISVCGRADLRILASCHAPLHPGSLVMQESLGLRRLASLSLSRTGHPCPSAQQECSKLSGAAVTERKSLIGRGAAITPDRPSRPLRPA